MKARELFLLGTRWLKRSEAFYVIDGHVSTFSAIQQDHSHFLRHLATFEPDVDNKWCAAELCFVLFFLTGRLASFTSGVWI